MHQILGNICYNTRPQKKAERGHWDVLSPHLTMHASNLATILKMDQGSCNKHHQCYMFG
jgi:hypothetical protein